MKTVLILAFLANFVMALVSAWRGLIAFELINIFACWVCYQTLEKADHKHD
jgi:ABC-type nickel/cobalt efflux system permease component RcnA